MDSSSAADKLWCNKTQPFLLFHHLNLFRAPRLCPHGHEWHVSCTQSGQVHMHCTKRMWKKPALKKKKKNEDADDAPEQEDPSATQL